MSRALRIVLLIGGLALGVVGSAAAQGAAPDLAQWQGARALADIRAQVGFGARAPDTPGHQKTIALIEGELRRLGLSPQEQRWTSTLGGRTHPMVNIFARMYPENSRQIILGTHYDSIIRAYRDKAHPDAIMPGANNSASGVALLLETARALTAQKASPSAIGIDFVFFDGEEGPISLGAGDPNWQPLGSPYFAQHLAAFYPGFKPEQAAIFDMVCWREEKLRPEPASLFYAPDEVGKFWTIGRHVAPAYFSAAPTAAPIYDDQIALDQAGIPAFLVIGFDYEPWFNTTGDTPDKCSAAALEGVGRSLMRYIYAH